MAEKSKSQLQFQFSMVGEFQTLRAKKWLAPNWIGAGDVVVVEGAPGSGKSTVVASLAVAIATGVHWLGQPIVDQGSVLWFGVERADDTRRLRARRPTAPSLPIPPRADVVAMPANIISSEPSQDAAETLGTMPSAKRATPSLVRVNAPGTVPAGTSNERTSEVVALEFSACRGRGRRLPDTTAALAERDALLREMQRRFFASLSTREAARQIEVALLRFRATAWRRERVLIECPTRHVGRVAELLWKLLHVRDSELSFGLIRAVLSRDMPLFVGHDEHHCHHHHT